MSNIKYNFDGKVVLITGSSTGIGATTAILFAKSGANVVITSNIEEQLSEVAENCEIISPNNSKPLKVLADVTKEDDLKKLVEKTINEFGKLDVLINNVGIGVIKPITDPDYMGTFSNVINTNLYSTVYLTHLCVEYLAKTNGNIINTLSAAALISEEQLSSYCVSKSALLMFTKCMAAELGPKRIRVNAISPGSIRTNIMMSLGISKERSDEIYDNFSAKYPIGRVGTPEDIANAMQFLASVESSFITGANILVDGGHIAANLNMKLL